MASGCFECHHSAMAHRTRIKDGDMPCNCRVMNCYCAGYVGTKRVPNTEPILTVGMLKKILSVIPDDMKVTLVAEEIGAYAGEVGVGEDHIYIAERQDTIEVADDNT